MQTYQNIWKFVKAYILVIIFFWTIFLSILWFWPLRGLIGVYYDNPNWEGEPQFLRRDKIINLEIIREQQIQFPQRNFSIRWQGWVRIDQEGTYTFSTISDDGSSLVIDGNTVVENGGYHGAIKKRGDILLSKGLHSIQMNYFQGAGDFTLAISWIPPGKSETSIKTNVLYPHPFPIRGIGLMTRYLSMLYPVSWIVFIVIGLVQQYDRIKKRGRRRTHSKTYVMNVGVSLLTVFLFLGMGEVFIRMMAYMKQRRQDAQALLQNARNTAVLDSQRKYEFKDMVQASLDNAIVYELKPNLHGEFMKVPVFTNSHGLRDDEYPKQKPKNTFRIVGLGDSCLFGWGVRGEETSLSILERVLNKNTSTHKYEVLNFGVPAYNTAIEAEVFLKKCLEYDPDLVLLHFFANDYDIPYFIKSPQSYATLRKSYLFDFVYTRIQNLRGIQTNQAQLQRIFEDKTTDLEKSESFDQNPAIPEQYRYMAGMKGVTKAFSTIAETANSRKIPFVAYILYTYPGLAPEATYPSYALRTRQLELITRLSQEHDFYCLNMYPYYDTYKDQHPELKYPEVFWVGGWEDVHPSVIAHQIEAKAFHDFLRTHQLIPD